MVLLRKLQLTDEPQFQAALMEPWESDFVFAHYYESLAKNSFLNYPRVLGEIARGNLLPDGHVPSTLLFAFDKRGRLVGRVSIRHVLNDALTQVGGHIGYGVVPSERRQGYATEILAASLDYVKKHHPKLTKVLLTCNDDNHASIRTIEKNGGKLENVVKTAEMPVGKRRYWISVT